MRPDNQSCKSCHWFCAGDSMGRGRCFNEQRAYKIKSNSRANNAHAIDKISYAGMANTDWCPKWEAIKGNRR